MSCRLYRNIVKIIKIKTIERHTVVERLEVANEFNIFIDGGFFGVNCPSQHMAAELHVVLSWRQNKKTTS